MRKVYSDLLHANTSSREGINRDTYAASLKLSTKAQGTFCNKQNRSNKNNHIFIFTLAVKCTKQTYN